MEPRVLSALLYTAYPERRASGGFVRPGLCALSADLFVGGDSEGGFSGMQGYEPSPPGPA